MLFSKLPLSPNAWTGMGLVLSIINLYFMVKMDFLSATIIFAFAALIDMIDGSVARIRKRVTNLGGYLDSVTDRAVEFVIIMGLIYTLELM